MKKARILLLPFIFSLLLLSLDNSSTPAANTGAKIKFEEESYDFGEIKQGDRVSHTFIFTNTGDEVLILKRVRGS